MKEQKFKCKEPGCSLEVVFKYEPIRAMKFMKDQEYEEMEATLSCDNGHFHKYIVSVPQRRR